MTGADVSSLAAGRQRSKICAGISRIPSWSARYRVLLMVTDAVAIAFALVLTYIFRFGDDAVVLVSGSRLSYPAVGFLVGALGLLILEAVESRSCQVFGAGLEEYRRVINASLFTFGVVAIVSYLAQAEISRIFFMASLLVGVVLLLTGRWFCRAYLNRVRSAGRALTPTVLVGDHDLVVEAVRDMRRRPEAGYLPGAVCVIGGSPAADEDLHGLRRVEYAELVDFLERGQSKAVAIAGGLSRPAVRRLAWDLENVPVELLFVPRFADVAGPRISMRAVDGLNLTQVDLPRHSGWNHVLKRGFDLVLSYVALILLFPVLVMIALAIKLDDGGPVIFRQQRVGLHGEPFTIHKFRTMSVDAEARFAALKAASISSGPLFKMAVDPRVTSVGRILRRLSLDELPQFWTVLRGRMSVVGPRPHLAHELDEFPDEGLRRLLIKPGITGLWQVSGRSDLPLEESIRLDLSYVENWSLTGDVVIVLKTVRAVVRPRGAY